MQTLRFTTDIKDITEIILIDKGIRDLQNEMSKILSLSIPKYIIKDGNITPLHDEKVQQHLNKIKELIKSRKESIINSFCI